MNIRKKMLIPAVMLLISAAGVFACEFTYSLTAPDGKVSRLTPADKVSLEEGEQYVLTVSYVEDHKKCTVAPEDTLFLLEDERWKAGKDYLPLTLLSSEGWAVDGRSYLISFTFTASKQGNYPLEIIRECARGGYRASLNFIVA
ncbi:MAG: hypothetical protein RBT69_11970 [Spirochaetia bacterium]|nr:hypothetical protein [Spirochaetia bacterium]